MGRSIKKGPFVQAALLKHVEAMNASGKKQVIKTWSRDRKSTRLNSSHSGESRMPSSA